MIQRNFKGLTDSFPFLISKWSWGESTFPVFPTEPIFSPLLTLMPFFMKTSSRWAYAVIQLLGCLIKIRLPYPGISFPLYITLPFSDESTSVPFFESMFIQSL